MVQSYIAPILSHHHHSYHQHHNHHPCGKGAGYDYTKNVFYITNSDCAGAYKVCFSEPVTTTAEPTTSVPTTAAGPYSFVIYSRNKTKTNQLKAFCTPYMMSDDLLSKMIRLIGRLCGWYVKTALERVDRNAESLGTFLAWMMVCITTFKG